MAQLSILESQTKKSVISVVKALKKVLSFVLVVIILLSTGTFVYADGPEPTSTETTYLPEGYYLVTNIYLDEPITRAQMLTGGSAVQTLYDATGDIVLTFTVFGTFKHNGTTCIATIASYDYEIYAFGWYFVSATAYCQDNVAIAEGRFKNPLLGTVDTMVTLSCTPNGTLS